MNGKNEKPGEAKKQEIMFQVCRTLEKPFIVRDELTLLFGLEGETAVQMNGESKILLPGGMIAVSPGVVHEISCMGNASALALLISESFRKKAGERSGSLYRCYEKDTSGEEFISRRLRELFAGVLKEYLQNRKQISDSFYGPAMQLMRHMIEYYHAGQGAQVRQDNSLQRLQRILGYIHAHWNEEITLTEIAEQEYLSVGYLSRFIQKNLGMNFSAVLRSIRIGHSKQMLLTGDMPVTQIAYDCGFSAASVYIEAFKQKYHMTPGQYRQSMQEGSPGQAGGSVSFSAVYDYLPDEKREAEPGGREDTYEIEIPCGRESEDVSAGIQKDAWGRILNVGYARDVLAAPVREQICRAQREIGFTWLRFHGLFDDDMHLYSEQDGEPHLSFAYVDLVFDFILEQGLIPFVEFSFMPSQLAKRQTRIYDRPTVISGCRDTERWKALIRGVLLHWIARYGREEVKKWRFTTISITGVRIGCLDWDEYLELYEASFRAVKDICGDLQFGGSGCFPDMLWNDRHGAPAFLKAAAQRDCMPDFHTIQWYPNVETDDALFMEYTRNQASAPAILSTDPDFLQKGLERMTELLKEFRQEGKEIFLEECASTLWQRDISGDTCYKAVWLAHNMHISRGKAVFGYWLLTDLIEERAMIDSVFHGGYGLFTYNGIPKAGYQAMCLIARMGNEMIGEGDGWILTKKEERYQLLTYNYCHYTDLNCFRYSRLERPEDAYSVFEQGERRRMQFHLRGVKPGKYRMIRRHLSKKQGSSFDRWVSMCAPETLSHEETSYLKDACAPDCRAEEVRSGGTLAIEAALEPLEMELIEIIPVAAQAPLCTRADKSVMRKGL